jgi:hypothetical protein
MRTLLVILALSLAALGVWKVSPFGTRPGGVASAASKSISFTVTNSGATAYLIDGQPNVALMLHRGETYVFNVNATGHPFYIKTARVTGTGSQYTQGLTGQGATGGPLTFVVPLDAPSTLFYQCSVHGSMGGTLNIVDALDVPPGVDPSTVWLAPPSPNPARDGALFRFGLPRASVVRFGLYDSRGRQIRDLQNGRMPAGEHSIRWDGRDRAGNPAPNGIYFYGLEVDGRRLGGRLAMRR